MALVLVGMTSAITGDGASVFAAERVVVCEDFTATWCTPCHTTGFNLGVLMDANPTSFAFIQCHIATSCPGCSVPWGLSRDPFYGGVTSIPSVWFDGLDNYVGAMSLADYTGYYNDRRAVPTDVTIDLTAAPISGLTYEINATVCIEAGGVAKSMRVHIIQVLDHYPTSEVWDRATVRQGLAYEDISLTPGDCTLVQREITLDATSWANQEHIRIIAFAQAIAGSAPAEIYQAAILPWTLSYALNIDLPDGVPEYIPPGEPTDITVQIEDGYETYMPDSGLLHYRYDGGAFLTEPLASLGGDLHGATLPAAACDSVPEFYISAEGDEGTAVFSPEDAPASVFSTTVATFTTMFHDDFELDLGWTVVNDPSLAGGEWDRAIPGMDVDRGAPREDYDGSGYCYVTDSDYYQDVDFGPTHLISPTVDLSDLTTAILRFAYWWSNNGQDGDPLDIAISNDNGDTWIPVMTISNDGYPVASWTLQDIDVGAAIDPEPLTSEMKVRFSVSDPAGSPSIDEGGIDAVEIFDVTCVQCMAGDIDCNGELDEDDVSLFVGVLVGTVTSPQGYIDRSNLNGDTAIDGLDVQPFVEAFVP